jgi:hypothetical protein
MGTEIDRHFNKASHMKHCLGDCNTCKQPIQFSNNHWCYDEKYKLPPLLNDPEYIQYTIKGERVRERVINLGEVEV